MKISYYILLSFGIILLLFSITTYFNIYLSRAIAENSTYLSRSTNIVRNTGRFQRNILTMVNGLRGYLLTGQRTFIVAYDSANIENDLILMQLAEDVTDSSQSILLQEINALNADWTKQYTEPVRDAKMLAQVSAENLAAYNKVYKEKFASGRESQIQNELQEKCRAFTISEYAMRDTKREALSERVQFTTRISVVFMIISILIGVGIIVFMIYKISSRIKQMSAMANKIAAGDYNARINESIRDELNPLGQSLNRMAFELANNISLLKRSNAELEEFAHVVSHDMKGPLRGIGNVIAWIEEDHQSELTSTLAKYLDLMKGRVIKAENMVEGLLLYARADREEVTKERFSLNSLMEEVLETLPAHPGINIEVGMLPTLHAEKLLLFQVFSNLVGNAIKYMDKPNGLIKVYYKEHDDVYEFFVEDNGMGIAPQHHKRIFIIFQTLRDTNNPTDSSGVGLAIVKKIISSKNQQVNLQSKEGEGSVFSFTWPKI